MSKFDCCCDCNAINYDKCSFAKETLGKIRDFDKYADFFKNFADETRLKIICALDISEKMCVCDIAYSLGMTKSAISHQLKYLKDNNLVKANKVGKEVYYQLSDNHVKDIFEIGIEHIREDK